MAKKASYSGGKVVTFQCISCGKKVSLPSWGRERKYCSIKCWSAESNRRTKAKNTKKAK
jgi:endogenous inhibitor of DNA gyrase (YacG/DUF329 family)